jgi:hypothetical protein
MSLRALSVQEVLVHGTHLYKDRVIQQNKKGTLIVLSSSLERALRELEDERAQLYTTVALSSALGVGAASDSMTRLYSRLFLSIGSLCSGVLTCYKLRKIKQVVDRINSFPQNTLTHSFTGPSFAPCYNVQSS